MFKCKVPAPLEKGLAGNPLITTNIQSIVRDILS